LRERCRRLAADFLQAAKHRRLIRIDAAADHALRERDGLITIEMDLQVAAAATPGFDRNDVSGCGRGACQRDRRLLFEQRGNHFADSIAEQGDDGAAVYGLHRTVSVSITGRPLVCWMRTAAPSSVAVRWPLNFTRSPTRTSTLACS